MEESDSEVAAQVLMVLALYSRVLSDPDLQPYFVGASVPRLIRHQFQMFSAIMSESDRPNYDVKAVHRQLQVTDAHFTKLIEHTRAMLEESSVSSEKADRLVQGLESYRSDIVKVEGDD